LHILRVRDGLDDKKNFINLIKINGSISNAFTNRLKQTYKLVCVCGPGKPNKGDIIQNHCPCGVFFFGTHDENMVMFFEKFFLKFSLISRFRVSVRGENIHIQITMSMETPHTALKHNRFRKIVIFFNYSRQQSRIYCYNRIIENIVFLS